MERKKQYIPIIQSLPEIKTCILPLQTAASYSSFPLPFSSMLRTSLCTNATSHLQPLQPFLGLSLQPSPASQPRGCVHHGHLHEVHHGHVCYYNGKYYCWPLGCFLCQTAIIWLKGPRYYMYSGWKSRMQATIVCQTANQIMKIKLPGNYYLNSQHSCAEGYSSQLVCHSVCQSVCYIHHSA